MQKKLNKVDYILPEDLAPYINCVMLSESTDPNGHTNIPIYADGYPGIMFQQSQNGFFLLPKNKQLSELFLYGQTLDPISLDAAGKNKTIVIQLYPFASKYLLNIDPMELNDDCYDLLQIDYLDVDIYRKKIVGSDNMEEQLEVILELMRQLIKAHRVQKNDAIQKAISIILYHKGQIRISELIKQVYITERTLERNFARFIGLKPKQFSKIVQFQSSINSLTHSSYNSLLEVGLDSGFSDQSHFIRTFKQYTGKTPSFYLSELKAG